MQGEQIFGQASSCAKVNDDGKRRRLMPTNVRQARRKPSPDRRYDRLDDADDRHLTTPTRNDGDERFDRANRKMRQDVLMIKAATIAEPR